MIMISCTSRGLVLDSKKVQIKPNIRNKCTGDQHEIRNTIKMDLKNAQSGLGRCESP